MTDRKIIYKNYLIMLKYEGTPNISIFKAEKDGSFITNRFPDAFWFAETNHLLKEAIEEIGKHEKLSDAL